MELSLPLAMGAKLVKTSSTELSPQTEDKLKIQAGRKKVPLV